RPLDTLSKMPQDVCRIALTVLRLAGVGGGMSVRRCGRMAWRRHEAQGGWVLEIGTCLDPRDAEPVVRKARWGPEDAGDLSRVIPSEEAKNEHAAGFRRLLAQARVVADRPQLLPHLQQLAHVRAAQTELSAVVVERDERLLTTAKGFARV